MSVYYEAGYTLPGADYPVTHARVLHAKNYFRKKTAAASSTATGSTGDEPLTPSTHDYWEPFDNDLAKPLDLSDAEWTKTGVTISGDRVTEDTSTGNHQVQDTGISFSAQDYVFAALVTRGTRDKIDLEATDGTTTFRARFNLDDEDVDDASNATGNLVSLGEDKYLCRIYFTAASGTGSVTLRLQDDSGNDSYTGVATNYMDIHEVWLHASDATWTLTIPADAEADSICIAGHNFGTRAGRIEIQDDSTGSYVTTVTIDPTDDSPIMAIFEPNTTDNWRVKISRCAGPKIGVIRVGKLLQFPRPQYGGIMPPSMNRVTNKSTAISARGAILESFVVGTVLEANFVWSNLARSWAFSNLPDLIWASEREPIFIAYRPDSSDSNMLECSYMAVDSYTPPDFIAPTKLMNFGIMGRALAHD